MDFQQSRTYVNLQAAYNTELMSSTRYQIYGDKARRDGFVDISNVFNTTAGYEMAHAVIWLRQLNNNELPSTQKNLEESLKYENFTGNEMYREFSKIAKEEGYDDIAALFNGVANIELNHDLVFQNLLKNVVTNQVFCKPVEELWICLNCGNIMGGTCAPEICPVCSFPQAYYTLYLNENT